MLKSHFKEHNLFSESTLDTGLIWWLGRVIWITRADDENILYHDYAGMHTTNICRNSNISINKREHLIYKFFLTMVSK